MMSVIVYEAALDGAKKDFNIKANQRRLEECVKGTLFQRAQRGFSRKTFRK